MATCLLEAATATLTGEATMGYVKGADFCFTGFTVVWPVLCWSGNIEAGAVVAALLLYGAALCGMMAGDVQDS